MQDNSDIQITQPGFLAKARVSRGGGGSEGMSPRKNFEIWASLNAFPPFWSKKLCF